jgi:hypothetical protein
LIAKTELNPLELIFSQLKQRVELLDFGEVNNEIPLGFSTHFCFEFFVLGFSWDNNSDILIILFIYFNRTNVASTRLNCISIFFRFEFDLTKLKKLIIFIFLVLTESNLIKLFCAFKNTVFEVSFLLIIGFDYKWLLLY